MKYYFDTSVLFKLYHREEGSDAAELIYESAESLFVSEICHVEFYSTLTIADDHVKRSYFGKTQQPSPGSAAGSVGFY